MRFNHYLRTSLIAGWALLAIGARADQVLLATGGSIEGRVVKDADVKRSQLAIDSAHGRIVLDRDQIERVVNESPAQTEYRRRAPTVSDTLEAQWALAAWCRDNGVRDGMKRHLERVLQLDPDHEQARALLGYQQIDGTWMTRDQVLSARGLVRWEGQWRTRQEVALVKRQEAAEAIQIEWRKRLAQWRTDLTSRNPEVVRAAENAFDTLDDPQAIGELLSLLEEEENPRVRRKLVDVIGRLGTPPSLAAMARIVLTDTDQELRAIALEYLQQDGSPGLASPFVGSLRSKDNRIVNNAADALSVLGTRSTLEPLIEALVTTHQYRVGADSGGDQYSVNSAAGTFGFGGGGAKDIKKQQRNPRVLAALVSLTQVNFLYDEARWKAWLANQQVEAAVDLRRDE